MKETRRGVGAAKARERKRREVRGPCWVRRVRRERRWGFEVRTLMGRLERKRVLSVGVDSGAMDSWRRVEGSSSSAESSLTLSSSFSSRTSSSLSSMNASVGASISASSGSPFSREGAGSGTGSD
jgi:hypothetical protein